VIAVGLYLAVHQQATPAVTVSELIDRSAKVTRVEIVAGLPDQDRETWASANVLARVLSQGTHNYTAYQLLTYATLAGDPIRIVAGQDHLRIGFAVPAGDLRLALELTDELVREALLPEEEVTAAIEELPFRRRTPWLEAWMPLKMDPKQLSRDDIVSLYRRVFRPGNVSIAIGGVLPQGEARRTFVERFATWQATDPGRLRRGAKIEPVTTRPGPMTTISMWGPVVRPIPSVSTAPTASYSLAEAAIACVMLGQGKGCSAYRVLRERNGWSYRQEAMLVPCQDGLQAGLVFGTSIRDGVPDIADKARSELAEDVAKWGEPERLRAIELARATQELGLPLGVIALSGERPLSQSLEDRTYLEAYWRAKTGRSWNWKALLDDMLRVPLERAKAFASDWLSKGTTSVIVGR